MTSPPAAVARNAPPVGPPPCVGLLVPTGHSVDDYGIAGCTGSSSQCAGERATGAPVEPSPKAPAALAVEVGSLALGLGTKSAGRGQGVGKGNGGAGAPKKGISNGVSTWNSRSGLSLLY